MRDCGESVEAVTAKLPAAPLLDASKLAASRPPGAIWFPVHGCVLQAEGVRLRSLAL
jgi:hypothetical protein